MSDSVSNIKRQGSVFKWAAWAGIAAIVGYGIFYYSYGLFQDSVKEQLVDPDSAIFQNRKASIEYFCAEVNSKNRSGGYTGFKRVIVKRDGFVFFENEVPTYDQSSSGLAAAEKQLSSLQLVSEILKVDKEVGRSPYSPSSTKEVFRKMWSEKCESRIG